MFVRPRTSPGRSSPRARGGVEDRDAHAEGREGVVRRDPKSCVRVTPTAYCPYLVACSVNMAVKDP